MVGGILPIQMKRRNNSKNFKPGLLHLKDTEFLCLAYLGLDRMDISLKHSYGL